MNKNSIVLNFQDSLLHQADVDLLTGPHWLNDNIISFYFEYLEKVVYLEEKNILFISPQVVQCLKASRKSELSVFLDPLSAKDKKFIFFALNNCETMDKAGGTHWSLLVYSRPEGIFYHFDSLKGTNYLQAGRIAGKLLEYFNPTRTENFIEYECLQQCNSYDCGIFVLCHVDILLNYCLKNDKLDGCERMTEELVSNKRKNILHIISELKSRGY